MYATVNFGGRKKVPATYKLWSKTFNLFFPSFSFFQVFDRNVWTRNFTLVCNEPKEHTDLSDTQLYGPAKTVFNN